MELITNIKDGKTISPSLPKDKKNFIIDVDGVICEDIPNEEPERMITAKVNQSAKQKINELFEQGNIITFFTARTEKHREVTEKWMKEQNIKYHKIIFGKPRGGNYHYIDDRTVKATRFKGKFADFVVKTKKIQVFE